MLGPSSEAQDIPFRNSLPSTHKFPPLHCISCHIPSHAWGHRYEVREVEMKCFFSTFLEKFPTHHEWGFVWPLGHVSASGDSCYHAYSQSCAYPEAQSPGFKLGSLLSQGPVLSTAFSPSYSRPSWPLESPVRFNLLNPSDGHRPSPVHSRVTSARTSVQFG